MIEGPPSKKLDIPRGTVVHGHTVVRLLGSGQMGEVYEASAPDGHSVALKVLRAEGMHESGVYERFAREARICAELRSPHIVPVLDHGLHQGRPLLVMPLLAGTDLESWLDRVGPLRPDVAVAIALQVCEALSVAHARGVVHRDLKPANIFLSEGRGAMSAIVCDFGVAKIVDEDGILTASGAVLGTPLYMAPEQMLDSKRVDSRSDVWALGMTLFHMLSGQTAHGECKTIADLVLALSTNRLLTLQSVAQWVGPSLARVVHAALLPREKRFQRIDGFAAALRKWGPTPVAITRETLVTAPADMRASAAVRATLVGDAAELEVAEESTVADPGSHRSLETDRMVGKTLGGKYTLQRRLGAGGMGAVYEAVDPTGARVAVKVMLSAGGDDDGLRRFTREMKAARAIDSPYVVRPLDFGIDDKEKIPFFVMELLRGQDLSSLIASVGPLAPPTAAALFVQACDALDAAHALGIVHRDIKPSNLFLHEIGDGTVVLKVCDFGIAKRVESDVLEASTELTRTGGLLGSPIYMSPEHAKNAKNVDARSDVWSLGLSLHESLTALRPWQGCTSVGEVIVAICTEPVPPLSAHAPWVDAGIVAAVEKSLERDAARRWQSVAAFGDALRPHARPGPVRLEDLRSPDAAEHRTSARATSVRPPGMVTSGSLRGAARQATDDASVSLPMHRGGGAWRWALALTGVVALAGGGVVAVRSLGGERTGASPGTGSAAPSTARSLPEPRSSGPSTTTSAATAGGSAPAGASASASASSSASASAVTHAHPPPADRGRMTPRIGAAPAASPAAIGAATGGTSTPTTTSTPSVGRGVTATELPPGN